MVYTRFEMVCVYCVQVHRKGVQVCRDGLQVCRDGLQVFKYV